MRPTTKRNSAKYLTKTIKSTNLHLHYWPTTNDQKPTTRISGGADRDRTGGLLVANQALSQLSYSPLNLVLSCQFSVLSESN
jgi:hypothetical protein